MKKVLGLSVVLAIAPVSQAADIEAGKAKAATVCAACHGANGVSVSDTIPNLAAQRAGYLEAQLKVLKDGTRKNPVMNAIAAQLSPADIANVAAYFAAQPGPASSAKSSFLPNLATTRVTFPEGYKDTFTKYHTINFPATGQVRYYFANKTAVQAAKEGKPLPDGSVLFAEVYGAKVDADKKPVMGSDGFFVAEKLLFYTAMARGAGWGATSRDAAQRELELRRVHHRQAAAARGEPGRVPRLPQAARQGELHLHAEADRGSEIAIAALRRRRRSPALHAHTPA
jgi:cytochrome c553